MARPDYLIIGAMKCGTSTLAAQLGAQKGLFMSPIKEPNFFSDDTVYAKGFDWYESLFEGAEPGDLKGEASTHYTKDPVYPNTVPRLAEALEAPKFVYMVRDPIKRMISHYRHEWTMGQIALPFEAAVDAHPELIAFGQYGRQIAPYVERFGAERILLVELSDMEADPLGTLRRVCTFLGAPGEPEWVDDLDRVNEAQIRFRKLPLHDLLFESKLATSLRRTLVPQGLRDRIKKARRAPEPELSPALRTRLDAIYAEDRAKLNDLLGLAEPAA